METAILVAKLISCIVSHVIPLGVSDICTKVWIVVHKVPNNAKITKLLITKKKYSLLVTCRSREAFVMSLLFH